MSDNQIDLDEIYTKFEKIINSMNLSLRKKIQNIPISEYEKIKLLFSLCEVFVAHNLVDMCKKSQFHNSTKVFSDNVFKIMKRIQYKKDNQKI